MALQKIGILWSISVFCVAVGMNIKPEDRQLYNDLEAGRGLYGGDNKVTLLNATNFKPNVYGTKQAWIVEFYNSWCGHCQRFAPLWKTFAADVDGWRDVVIIAAIDCSHEVNTQLCREYEVMHYPYLKFFPAHSKSDNLGTEIQKGNTAEEMRHIAVDILRKEQVDGRGLHWPNIAPYRSNDVQNLWKYAPQFVEKIILIFEEADSYVGPEVTLDLMTVTDIQVRYVSTENEALFKLMAVSYHPQIVVLDRDLNVEHLKPVDNTRSGVRKTIKTFLRSKGFKVPEDSISVTYKSSDDVANVIAVVAAEREEKKRKEIKELGDVVFLTDLKMAVQESFLREIPLHKSISGEVLVSLKSYLNVLSKYLPVDRKAKAFIRSMKEYVDNVESELLGEDFVRYFYNLEGKMNAHPLTSVHDFLGCKGSKHTFRGYPCSLWMMFHTLTVNAVILNEHNEHFNSLEVLDAMLGYIKHFFGCQDCSNHFQAMAAESMHTEVSELNDGILWLWKAHNKANQRLSGDLTEDPDYPKVQFPTPERCPKCRDSRGNWLYSEVLEYLKSIYKAEKVSYRGHDKKALNEDKDQNFINSHDDSPSKVEAKRSGWYFSMFDMSLCVSLYLCCAILILLLFVKFVMKRRYRKKLYVHDLLGKV